VLCSLGTPIATPGFHKASYLFPIGQLVAWQDAKKTYTIFMSISAVKLSDAGNAASDGAATGEDEADAGPPPPPQEKPLFTVTAVKGDVSPPESGDLKELGSAAVELATSHISPDDVCNELFLLQKLAQTLPKPSADESAAVPAPEAQGDADKGNADAAAEKHEKQLARLKGNAELSKVLQEAPLPPVRWPRLLFGLSHAAVLTKLEGHPAVEHCTDYTYVEVSSLSLETIKHVVHTSHLVHRVKNLTS
jgi:hypothetical protein